MEQRDRRQPGLLGVLTGDVGGGGPGGHHQVEHADRAVDAQGQALAAPRATRHARLPRARGRPPSVVRQGSRSLHAAPIIDRPFDPGGHVNTKTRSGRCRTALTRRPAERCCSPVRRRRLVRPADVRRPGPGGATYEQLAEPHGGTGHRGPGSTPASSAPTCRRAGGSTRRSRTSFTSPTTPTAGSAVAFGIAKTATTTTSRWDSWRTRPSVALREQGGPRHRPPLLARRGAGVPPQREAPGGGDVVDYGARLRGPARDGRTSSCTPPLSRRQQASASGLVLASWQWK